MPAGCGPQEAARPPRIVWADLVFRVPPRQARSKVAPKERPGETFVAKGHPGSEGRNLGRQSRRANPPQRYQDCIRGAKAEGKSGPVPPECHAVAPSSCPGNVDSQEKRAVRTILVDLRPILEKAVDHSDAAPEEKSERGQRNDGEGLLAERGDLPGEGTIKGGGHATEMATDGSTDGGTLEDILSPLARDPFQAPSTHPESTHEAPEICPQSGDSAGLQEPAPQTALTHELKPGTAVSFPKTTPQEPGEDHLLRSIRPSASFPDFHLPTQLLLQRLQETTTSQHHSLITHVLSSLREELLVGNQPSLDDGNKAEPFLLLPVFKTLTSKKGDQKLRQVEPGRAAAKRTLGKFTWKNQ